ncbi:hypothetical protein H7992_09400 [Sporosarcina sp. resist]|uniref:hypothetical protein n=1 Tax=Sporosarcina sp. resist TaxID=2762563 RepID=UPI00164E1F36|nr:hypothetical protein [Sporosarcina sp. resist]QNK89837.1 hypothetical protein H7992_09400 [Sporosarcina sp. resist]
MIITTINEIEFNKRNLEVDQLKKDISKIDNVSSEELEDFQKENKEWIADVNNRLDEYIADVPEGEKEAELLKLLDVENQFGTMSAVSAHFHDHNFQLEMVIGLIA